ncbi:MAG: hypothetical protein Q9207_007241 [Kuettlingeria erythrocarpa]
MGTLLQLPIELLEGVLSHCHLKDLNSISRSCTTLHEVVLPRLYQKVEFAYCWGDDLTKLHLFVISILRHPARASFVRRLQITGEIYPPPSSVEACLTEHNLDLVKQILAPELFSSAILMLHHLASGTESSFPAVPALLLILLPRLQTARFSAGLRPRSVAVAALRCLSATVSDLLRPKSGSLSYDLRALEEIDYLTYPDPCGSHPVQRCSDALDLYQLPNIRSIQARAVEDISGLHWAVSPPYRPAITSLSLKNSCIRAGTLRKLLKATPNLRSLEYEYYCNFESPLTPIECPILDSNALRNVLDVVSASIESLALSLNFQSEWDWDAQDNIGIDGNQEWGVSGSLGPMNHFLKLGCLKAPLVMLVGWEPPNSSFLEHWLPEDLRQLCCSDELSDCYSFRWTESDQLRQMIPLIVNRSGRLQKLILGAELTSCSRLWSRNVRRAVEAKCNEVGVSYQLIECLYD